MNITSCFGNGIKHIGITSFIHSQLRYSNMKGFTVLLVACVAVARANEDPICPSEQEDNWGIELLLKHQDCNKFYKCTLGKPVEYNCYDGLYFNLDTWQCDWKDNVDCSGRNIPDEDQSAITWTPVQSTSLLPNTTTEENNTTTTEAAITEKPTPEPTTTTTTTIRPLPTTTKPVPEPETEAKPEEEEIIFQENGCPVDPHIHWLLPHEQDCGQFYYCVWGGKVARECPAGLHFNIKLQVCDWPASAGCTVALNKHFEFRQMLRQLL